MEMIINTVRMVDYDQAREHAIGSNETLEENLAIGLINPEDFKRLNLTPSLNLKIISKFGEVIIKIIQNEDIPNSTILMPVSIWANQITGFENNELIFKNIKVNVEATRDSVLTYESLLKTIKQ
ncbi:MAG: molybdopterin dinucleotide binding domain-containing protein [Candidatus Hermodarchaeota archaeon]